MLGQGGVQGSAARTASAIFLFTLIPRLTHVASDEFHATRRRGKSSTSTHLVLEMPVMRECLDTPDNAIRFYNMSAGMAGKFDFVLNGFFEISRNTVSMQEVVIDLTKCRERVSTNTCEHFQTWRFSKNICQIMFKNFFSSFNNNVTPRPPCPFRKGTYAVQNATFDIKMLQAIPLPWEGNVWLSKFFVFEAKNKAHMCVEVEAVVHRARDE